MENKLIFQPLVDDPDSKYVILACNINYNDIWIWKYHKKEHNFIPIFDDSQGDCIYKRDEIEQIFVSANSWIEGIKKSPNKELAQIWILKVN